MPIVPRAATHIRDEGSTLRTLPVDSDEVLAPKMALKEHQRVRVIDVAVAAGTSTIFFKVISSTGKTQGWIKSKYISLSHVEEEEDADFPVHKILQHRGKGAKKEYLVAWGGEYIGDTTWQVASDLEGCAAVVEYLAKKQ